MIGSQVKLQIGSFNTITVLWTNFVNQTSFVIEIVIRKIDDSMPKIVVVVVFSTKVCGNLITTKRTSRVLNFEDDHVTLINSKPRKPKI